MNRRPLIAGNWKMHLSVSEAVHLARAIADLSADRLDRDVLVAPAFTALSAVCSAVSDSPLLIGAQNVAWENQGAYTGEISPAMLNDLGVTWAIIGHSERRQIFFEDEAMINRRVHGALNNGIHPILCIGETLEERESGSTFAVLEQQLRKGLEQLTGVQVARLTLAYEPIWAIGTGKTATKEQAQEVHAFIRQLLASIHEKFIADVTRILYGGSVKPDNIDKLMAQPDIDGVLVGGAALQVELFDRIVHFQ